MREAPAPDGLQTLPLFHATRESELEQILRHLNEGRSVLVSAISGDGSSQLAHALSDHLDPGGTALLNAVAHLEAKDVDAFLSADGRSPVVIDMVNLLPDEAGAPIGSALSDPGTPPVAYFVDSDRLAVMNPGGSGPLAQVATAWMRGRIPRIDLRPLGDDEIADVIDSVLAPGILDDLQRSTLVQLADGQPVVAVDLVEEATADPAAVPRRLPRPGLDPMPIGRRTVMRILPRYSIQPAEVAGAALEIASLSPLPVVTAARLVGHSMISRLRAVRLVKEAMVDGRECLTVSPLHAIGLLHCHPEQNTVTRPGFRDELRRLAADGYPMGGVWMQMAARDLLKERDRIGDAEARLMLGAADAENRMGRADEAAVLEAAVEREIDARVRENADGLQGHRDSAGPLDVDLQSDLDTRLLSTELVRGHHRNALAIARRVLSEQRDALGRLHEGGTAEGSRGSALARAHDVLHQVGLALAWAPELPDWYEADVADLASVDPDAATVLRGFAADPAVGAEDFRSVADCTTSAPELRLRCMAALAMHYLNEGDGEAVHEMIHVGGHLLGDMGAWSDDPVDSVPYPVARYFGFMGILSCAMAGTYTDWFRDAVDAMVHDATGLSRRAAWPTGADSVLVAGLLHLLEGDSLSAARDAMAAAEEVRPAMLPGLWQLTRSLGSLARASIATPTRMAGWRAGLPVGDVSVRQPFWAMEWDLLGGRSWTSLKYGESRQGWLLGSAPGPAWLEALALEDGLARGRMGIDEARRRIDLVEPSGLPAVEAVRSHVIALSDKDADGLLEAGTALVRTGRVRAAEHAFVHARVLYLRSRSAAGAERAEELLRLSGRDVRESPEKGPRAVEKASPVRGASLTKREREICALVAEGLTNTQIGDRLVLSVRTVESHVFMARAKLGAKRRSDIPARLAEQMESQ